MSGLSRTPGKRVWVNSPPRVRIPLAPPLQKIKKRLLGAFLLLVVGHCFQLLLSCAFLMTFLASVLLLAAAELIGF